MNGLTDDKKRSVVPTAQSRCHALSSPGNFITSGVLVLRKCLRFFTAFSQPQLLPLYFH